LSFLGSFDLVVQQNSLVVGYFEYQLVTILSPIESLSNLLPPVYNHGKVGNPTNYNLLNLSGFSVKIKLKIPFF
jgi:hypothetical protein